MAHQKEAQATTLQEVHLHQEEAEATLQEVHPHHQQEAVTKMIWS